MKESFSRHSYVWKKRVIQTNLFKFTSKKPPFNLLQSSAQLKIAIYGSWKIVSLNNQSIMSVKQYFDCTHWMSYTYALGWEIWKILQMVITFWRQLNFTTAFFLNLTQNLRSLRSIKARILIKPQSYLKYL